MILVTGPSGFVGSSVVREAVQRGIPARRACRFVDVRHAEEMTTAVGNIGSTTNWQAAVNNVNVVIHCAAYVHMMREISARSLATYREVNVEGTRGLAEQAAASGVKRFIFLSSIKVNGERTISGSRFTAEDNVFPEDAYAMSKWEAELALCEISARTGLEVVIIRPPLVYGPGVKGNFCSLLTWVNRGIPLPFGAIHNRRSMVGIDNLTDLIFACIDHPAAANQTFLVKDDEDLSTTDLMRRLGKALHKPARLLSTPTAVLEVITRMVGKKEVANRLMGNLQVDMSKTREVLEWSPPVSVDEGLQKTADWFLSQR